MNQLATAGVKYSVADTMQVAGGARGPAANYNAASNTVFYNPRTAREPGAYRGVMEHELVHAAASNIAPWKLGSLDPRLTSQYIMGQQARRPGNLLNTARAVGLLPFVGKLGGWAEGLADRSGAYPDIPKWGDKIRRNITGR